jgi:hypothetical protein
LFDYKMVELAIISTLRPPAKIFASSSQYFSFKSPKSTIGLARLLFNRLIRN